MKLDYRLVGQRHAAQVAGCVGPPFGRDPARMMSRAAMPSEVRRYFADGLGVAVGPDERFILARRVSIPLALKILVLRAFGATCVWCGRPLLIDGHTTVEGLDDRRAALVMSPDYWVEHLVQVIHGGNHRLENLAPACRPCNISRGHRYGWFPGCRVPSVAIREVSLFGYPV